MGIPYATREQIARSLEVLETSYSNTLIDAKIDASSRSAEGFLHRRFYPELRTILLDWPRYGGSPSYEVELGDQEMISVAAVNSGGTIITSNVILRRGDDLAEPPYDRLQINLSSSAVFSAGTSWQRSLSIQGLFGYSDTATSLAGATLTGAINSSVATITLSPSNGYYTPGVGSLILIDSERLLLIDRRMATTSQTISSSLTDLKSATSFTSAGAANFAVGEIILVDSERMRINDIAGTTIFVSRAWDGTVLNSHISGATIFALRQFVVRRGMLGSTAASHLDAAAVYIHEYPSLLNELVVAETVSMLGQNASGYAQSSGSGRPGISSSGWSSRSAGSSSGGEAGAGLSGIREQAYIALGRKQRSRAV